MQHAYLDRAYAPPRARRVSILESLYRISPRRWLMLDRKGRICAGGLVGPQFGKLSRLSGWASAAPIRSHSQPDRQTARQTARASSSPPPSTVQTRPGSCPLVLRHARTHALTRNRRRGSGGPQAGQLGRPGTHAPPPTTWHP